MSDDRDKPDAMGDLTEAEVAEFRALYARQPDAVLPTLAEEAFRRAVASGERSVPGEDTSAVTYADGRHVEVPSRVRWRQFLELLREVDGRQTERHRPTSETRDYRADVIGFCDAFIQRTERGEAWRLTAYQRRALARLLPFDATGRLALRVLLWSEPKKSGKTFLAACLALWWSYTRAGTEILIAANDLDQSVGRVFATAVALLEKNPALLTSATVTATRIELTNGSTLTAIPSDWKGEAGGRQSLVIFDELWGYTQEAAVRLFEECTPIPTIPEGWILIVSTAGFSGESVLLERLWKRAESGVRLDDDLELYRDEDLRAFLSQTARQPWQSTQYYAEQRRLLRPNTFARLHENRWMSSESRFILPELWDGCVDPARRPLLSDWTSAIFVGVDASQKHDSTAVVAVRWEGPRLALVCHKIWVPTPDAPIDLEATVEAYLRDLHARFPMRTINADPWQLARSIRTLKTAGLPIRELAQTVGNTTSFAQSLFDALIGRTLALYPDDQLRSQALNTVAIESPRGWRIAKEKASRKIDGIVALAMAIAGAIADPARGRDALIWDYGGSGRVVSARRWAAECRAREMNLPLLEDEIDPVVREWRARGQLPR